MKKMQEKTPPQLCIDDAEKSVGTTLAHGKQLQFTCT